MSTPLQILNNLDTGRALEYLQHCCDSILWAHQVTASRPYNTVEELMQTSDLIWAAIPFEDRLEAFDGHPRFGNQKIGNTTLREQWSRQEHEIVTEASVGTLEVLKRRNLDYEQVFGFTFIASTDNRSLDDLLELISDRTQNDPETEVAIASEEQRLITRARLAKLLQFIEHNVQHT